MAGLLLDPPALPPLLSIKPFENQVLLTWPTTHPGYIVEEVDFLDGSNSWISSGFTVEEDAGQFRVLVDPLLFSQKFFRLRH